MLLAASLPNVFPMAEAMPVVEADTDLVRRAAAGDERAFEALYRRHVKRIHGVVWRLVGGVEARAEELVQDAVRESLAIAGGFARTGLSPGCIAWRSTPR